MGIPTRASCVLRKEKSFLDCLKTKDAVCEVIMAENAEVTETSTPPDAQPTLPPTNHPSPPAAAAHATPTHHGHEATFVRPSDLLRPRTTSRPAAPKPERPIDRDERAGLLVKPCRHDHPVTQAYTAAHLRMALIRSSKPSKNPACTD